jgi:trimeric autotransporter adhesin
VVAAHVVSLLVTPTVADGAASAQVNGTAVVSGSGWAPIALSTGTNPITVAVTAPAGAGRIYTVTVTRLQSDNADLGALTLSDGTLTPDFAAGTTVYTAAVPNSVSSLTVTAIPVDSLALVAVNGVTMLGPGGAAAPISLDVGPNLITLVVTAEDGVTTQTYTLTVTRAALSSDAALTALTTDQGTWTKPFHPSSLAYTVIVPSDVRFVTLFPTAAAGATVTVNGTPLTPGTSFGPIDLVSGNHVFTLVVTAEDGETTRTYTVTVRRLPTGTVTGVVQTYSDPNARGMRVQGLFPVPGVMVAITHTTCPGVRLADLTPVTTDASGVYTITGLDTGLYTLSFTLPEGYAFSDPDAGTLVVVVIVGETVSGVAPDPATVFAVTPTDLAGELQGRYRRLLIPVVKGN